MPNPQNEIQKQLMAQFFTGIMQSVQAKKQRMAQAQKEQALYEQGQNDKTYEAKLKYFQELSKSDNPQHQKFGFEGLKKLGIIDDVPETETGSNKWLNQFGSLGAGAQTALAKGIFGEEEQKFKIPGLEGYGASFDAGNVISYESSKNRTAAGSDDKTRTAKRNELKILISSLQKESEKYIRNGRITDPKYNEIMMSLGAARAELNSLGTKKGETDPIMEMLQKQNELMDKLLGKYK